MIQSAAWRSNFFKVVGMILPFFLCGGLCAAGPRASYGIGPKAAKPDAILRLKRMAHRHDSVRFLEQQIALLKAKHVASSKSLKAKDSQGEERAEEESGTDYLEAYLYYLRQRAYPNDTVDWSVYSRAEDHRQKMKPAAFGLGAAFAPEGVSPNIGNQWEFVGPNRLAIPYRVYYGLGPLSGRVNAVAFDPIVKGVYYVGTAGGGFWKTTDAGVTWTSLSDTWPSLQVSSIALDPTNAKTIYVGTGDFPGYGSQGFGLMKTTDGGNTWTNLGKNEFGSFAVSAIAVDQENPKIITVAAGRPPQWWAKLWRSTDGGITWKVAIDTDAPWSGLAYGAMDSHKRRMLYAVGHYNGGQVWRSKDRGVTWTKLAPPISQTNWWEQDSLQIAASPIHPSTVYLISGFDRKILKSTNAGATWTDITGNFPNGGGYNWSQNSYDVHIECGRRKVGPVMKDVVYVGLIDLAQSIGGNTQWRTIGGPTFDGSNSILHNDQHCLAVNPFYPSEALVGCDGGVYQLDFNAAWDQWSYTSLNSALGITQFYRAAYYPGDPDIMMGGTQDNATPASFGSLSEWGNVGGGDGGFCAINPTDPTIKYSTAQNLAIFRVDTAWSNATYISRNWGSDRKAFIAPITLDMQNPDLLYAGTDHLYRWNNAIQQWSNALGGQLLDNSNGYLQYIAVAPGNDQVLYTGSTSGDLYRSADGGTTWNNIRTGIVSLPNRSITSIAVSSTNPNLILVGLSGTGSGHLWLCTDTSAGNALTWKNASGAAADSLPDVSLNAVAINPHHPATNWYVATDIGVFSTLDGGGTWQNATEPLGLPNVQCNDIHAEAGTGFLSVATYGRGIWRLPLP